VLNEAARLDMLVLLTPAYLGYGCGSQGWCQEMKANGTTKVYNYGVYLGNRYKNFKNLIWVNGGDVAAADYGAMDVVNALVNGIRSVDASHLHTAHCDRQRSGIDCYNQTWLQVNTTYSDCSRTAEKIKTDYERTSVKPFFYIEGTYENEGASQTCLRSQAYWAVLGGAFGHVFGNNPIWLFDSGWQNALNSTGAQSLQRFAALFASRPWHNLLPDYGHQVATSGYGSVTNSSYVGVARTSDHGTVMAYLPSSSSLTIDMTQISGSTANAWWYSPGSGASTFIGTYPTSGSRVFTPNGSGDWVLVLDDASLNLGAPGSGTPPPAPTEAADLALTKIANASSVVAGSPISYSLGIANDGPDTATNVILTDTLPAGLTYTTASASQGSCSHMGATVTCALGQISAGANATAQITVNTSTSGTYVNTASVTSAVADPSSANNSASAQTIVQIPSTPPPDPELADLVLRKSASASTVVSGNTVSFSLSVINNGPNTATSVTVSDPLPAGLSFNSASASQGTCTRSGSTVTCTLGTLSSGASATAQITVGTLNVGTFSNTASVSSTVADPVASNNTGTVQITVQSPSSPPPSDPEPSPPPSDDKTKLESKGGCAATVIAHHSWMTAKLRYLRVFRDRYLRTNSAGQVLTRTYYRLSPAIADVLRERAGARAVARLLLRPVVLFAEYVTVGQRNDVDVVVRNTPMEGARSR